MSYGHWVTLPSTSVATSSLQGLLASLKRFSWDLADEHGWLNDWYEYSVDWNHRGGALHVRCICRSAAELGGCPRDRAD